MKNRSASTTKNGVIAPKTPARAVKMTTSTEEERYLQRIALGFEEGMDKWHMMTSLPDHFKEKCDELKAHIEAVTDKRFLPQSHKALADRIYGCIYGSSGVNYMVTERSGLENAEVFAPHMAQTLIIEKVKNAPIAGIWHSDKASGTMNMFENVLADIEKIQKAITNPKLRETLSKFTTYLDMQADCIDAALKFDATKPLLADDEFADKRNEEVSANLLLWHSASVKHQTPKKEATPHRDAVKAHPPRKAVKVSNNEDQFGFEKSPSKIARMDSAADCSFDFYSGDATTTAHGDAASKSESSSSESESSEHESEEESPAQSQSQSQSQSTTLTPGFDNALRLAAETFNPDEAAYNRPTKLPSPVKFKLNL